VGHLLHWLQAATLDSRLGLLGALRGPGVGLSDTGLFCLRRGYGLRDRDGAEAEVGSRYLGPAAREFGLDPELAVAAWKARTGVEEDIVLPALRADAVALERFQGLMRRFQGSCRGGDLAGAVELLLDRAGLWAYWLEQPGGEQRLANLHAFIRFLREQESAGGAPADLANTLLCIRDEDDPAAGVLEAGADTPVCIMSYWQAKGGEWPVVVLPDIQLTKVKLDPMGAGSERLVLAEQDEVVFAPSVVETSDEKPFDAPTPEAIKALLNRYRLPAERAELRRLLYVAMTRAKERLIMTGEFDRPLEKKATLIDGPGGEPEPRITLGQARDWARTLQVATGLRIDAEGEPHLGSGVWSEEDVHLRGAGPLAAALQRPAPGGDADTLGVTPELLSRLAPVTSSLVPRLSPSSLEGKEVPAPDRLHGAYPEEAATREGPLSADDEGTALHALFEHWGYGAAEEPTADNVREILARESLGSGLDPEQDAGHLLAIFDRARAERPELVQGLARAADRGDLFHEIPLRYRTDAGEQVSGDIDLLWRDDEGWHLLDYKGGVKVPTATDPLQSNTLKKHHAQVSCYATGLGKLLGDPVRDYGIWYTRYGLVVRWAGQRV